MKKRIKLFAAIFGSFAMGFLTWAKPSIGPATISLDGADWLLATDPGDLGKEQQWWNLAQPGAFFTPVPWIIQDRFPGYHGIAWYWKAFRPPGNPHPNGRSLLRFWSVSYKADVWLNGIYLGGNEGTEVPFILDVTSALRPGVTNLLAVRVVDPTDTGTDGLISGQIPGGRPFHHGGIEDSVELLLRPAVYISDIYVHADPGTGLITIEAKAHNSLSNSAAATVAFSVSPTEANKTTTQTFEPGDTLVQGSLKLDKPRLWNLDDPFLYQVTTTIAREGSDSFDKQVTRTGFRDFRVENGYFRLNGRRIYLRAAHTGQQDPFGMRVPFNPDWPLEDLRLMKAMGFNTIRFFQALGLRQQLDFADEFGFLVYEEARGGWLMDYVKDLYEQRRNRSIRAMVLRDRNHPSIIAWGLLNESPWDLSPNNPIFLHAKGALPLIRSNDTQRLVILNSGRWDCEPGVGSVANPGSPVWQHLLGIEAAGAPRIDPLCRQGGVWPPPPALPIAGYVGPMGDVHVYPRVPHTAPIINFLRTVGAGTRNIIVSEYGIASAMDLLHMCNLYSQNGYSHSTGAKNFQRRLDSFMADWQRWQMGGCFGQPSNYFHQCYLSNARQRLDGINALRANPKVAGYSLTASVDTANAGEGVFNLFREEKPGIRHALTDAFAPLRWCLFTEPRNLYRGEEITLEAVLANEDVLHPGKHPVNIEVVGPGGEVVFTRQATHSVPTKVEPPLAVGVFMEKVKADWPAGEYHLRSTFADGKKAPGEDVTFHIDDPAEMPAVSQPIFIWGQDNELADWLSSHGIQCQPFIADSPKPSPVILASGQVPAPGGQAAFDSLIHCIEDGARVFFLDPTVFSDGNDPTAYVPLKQRGTPANSFDTSCYYAKDEWAKVHPVFAGMPSGGILDFSYYRELLPDRLWQGQDTPSETVAGAVATSFGYFSGTRLAIYNRGKGKWVLNMYYIRENLGKHPAAERLLRNTLNYLSPGKAETPTVKAPIQK